MYVQFACCVYGVLEYNSLLKILLQSTRALKQAVFREIFSEINGCLEASEKLLYWKNSEILQENIRGKTDKKSFFQQQLFIDLTQSSSS